MLMSLRIYTDNSQTRGSISLVCQLASEVQLLLHYIWITRCPENVIGRLRSSLSSANKTTLVR